MIVTKPGIRFVGECNCGCCFEAMVNEVRFETVKQLFTSENPLAELKRKTKAVVNCPECSLEVEVTRKP